jgi:hypothetical protein
MDQQTNKKQHKNPIKKRKINPILSVVFLEQ